MASTTPGAALRAGAAFVVRTSLVFVAVTAGSIVGGMALYRGVELPTTSDPAAFQTAMVWVNAIHALMLAVMASSLRVAPIRAAVVLFALFFGVQGLLTGMETAYFSLIGSLDLELDAIIRGLAGSAVTALFGAAAAAVAFRAPVGKRLDAPVAGRRPVWRILAAIALYPAVYWAAGLLIALPSEAVARFYANSIGSIDPATLLALQAVRGAIWAALALIVVDSLQGSRWLKVGLVGAAFAVFMAAQLLYPNAIMPADVRWIHFIEILISNLLYGFAAALLLDRRPSDRKEISHRASGAASNA